MKVLLIFAHPESASLNGSLHRLMLTNLEQQGHQVQISDLYHMRWKSQIDRDDFPSLPPDARLRCTKASSVDYENNSLTEDVKAEQSKLLWADTVIFQFPMWWFSVPAILKGWIDRVYACGFAYGTGEHNDKRSGDQYGEGRFAGKRAMLFVTVGGSESQFSARGIHGPIDDILFPINHGVLYYPGFDVLPPIVVYEADHADEAGFETVSTQVQSRMESLESTAPIRYRQQNGGDYLIPGLTLREGLEEQGVVGFALHTRSE
ncbi:Ribosyldihydronicotinamide dehydrogenase, partial [Lophiostoma macrostomum CBS 122681]